MDNIKKIIITCFRKFSPEYIIEIIPIKNSGSERKYFRLKTVNNSYICVYTQNTYESKTFFYFTKIFNQLNFNVPKILYQTQAHNIYFLNDLGDTHLLDLVVSDNNNYGKLSESTINMYKRVLSDLAYMQFKAYQNIDFRKTYNFSVFNEDAILSDLNYFKYYFLNRCGINYNEARLNRDFKHFANALAKRSFKLFMFRDFQARNILIYQNEPYYIDYQGGRKGYPLYDCASLLFQAKASIDFETQQYLADFYLKQLSKYYEFNFQDAKLKFWYFVFVRIMQTLGAYGLRGLIENKQHFKESLPLAIKQLNKLLNNIDVLSEYSELNKILHQISELDIFEPLVPDNFTVSINSFSYKTSYPQDPTGNGGGFVFDCRFLENPGIYPEFKNLTGKDKQVIEFLKNNSDADKFVNKVYEIIKPAIEKYQQRGYKSLQVNFGCTGGQHRSVYCAERLYEILKRLNINIVINHKELIF